MGNIPEHPLVINYQNSPMSVILPLVMDEEINLGLRIKSVQELGKEFGLDDKQIKFALEYVNPDSLGYSNYRKSAELVYGLNPKLIEDKKQIRYYAWRNSYHFQVTLLILILVRVSSLYDSINDIWELDNINNSKDARIKKKAILAFLRLHDFDLIQMRE